jgi:hypothetical protein
MITKALSASVELPILDISTESYNVWLVTCYLASTVFSKLICVGACISTSSLLVVE